MPRDSYSAPTGLPVVDRNARFRVHRWLSQPDSAARQPAVDCVAVLKPAGAEVVDSPAAVPALTARQKVAILWRKCEQTLGSLTRHMLSRLSWYQLQTRLAFHRQRQIQIATRCKVIAWRTS
jgi:hypothetical protein